MVSIFQRYAGRRTGIVALSLLTGTGLFGLMLSAQAAPPGAVRPAYLQNFPAFSPKLSPQLPGDVDLDLKKQLENASKFADVQREFDLYSWQMFLALNWPTNRAGQPGPSLTATKWGTPNWTLWHNSSTIFQHDGAKPEACGATDGRMMAASRDLARPVSPGLPSFSKEVVQGKDFRTSRFLGVISAVGDVNATNLSDIEQAFSGPLIDQNGEFVFYEIMIDPNETRYLCNNSLYNINGQVAFSKADKKVVMPSGRSNANFSGSFELKLAWRILKPGGDDFSRFHTSQAVVVDQGTDGKPVERSVTVGLVGMHIGHKSESSPQWIWSTFEQIDNLDTDPVGQPKLKPSFTDPSCPLCAVNQLPVADAKGIFPRVPTQAWRAIPIPGDKVRLNAQAQAILRQMGSVWQYYQLIDTQWPTDPKAVPTPWDGGLPLSVSNKAGGHPTPVSLTNITMETYFQKGNQDACISQEKPKTFTCPKPKVDPTQPAWNSKLNAAKTPTKPGNYNVTFTTESCTGCHSSAGLYKQYDPTTQKGMKSGQLTGDFSWLLAQKAQWSKGQ